MGRRSLDVCGMMLCGQSSFGEELRRYEGEQQRLAEMEEFDRAEALQHVIDQVATGTPHTI